MDEQGRRVDQVLGALEDFTASARRMHMGDLDRLRADWGNVPEDLRRRMVWTCRFVLQALERTPPAGPSDA